MNLVFYNIDAIQRAISAKKKVRFRYFKYDNRKKRVLQRDGRFYEETPLHLVYMDDCYYLVAWNDKHESTTNYRVDRMLNIDVSEEMQRVMNERPNLMRRSIRRGYSACTAARQLRLPCL